VSRLLALRRQSPIAPAMHDINAIVRDASATIHFVVGSRISLEIDLATEPCRVYAERESVYAR